MRIAICDDEPACLEQISNLIQQVDGYHQSWTVRTFHSGDQLLFAYEDHKHPFDIVVLDIRMEGTDGLSAGLAIREKDSMAILLFLTSYPQYALPAYDTYPLHFMVKPVPTSQFLTVLAKACVLVQERRQESIHLHGKELDRFLPLHEISYLESVLHTVIVHTTDDQHLCCSASLKSLLFQINKFYFVRTHKSYAVNLYEAESYHSATKEITMKNKALVPVSRKQLPEFTERFVKVHTHVEPL